MTPIALDELHGWWALKAHGEPRVAFRVRSPCARLCEVKSTSTYPDGRVVLITQGIGDDVLRVEIDGACYVVRSSSTNRRRLRGEYQAPCGTPGVRFRGWRRKPGRGR